MAKYLSLISVDFSELSESGLMKYFSSVFARNEITKQSLCTPTIEIVSSGFAGLAITVNKLFQHTQRIWELCI